MMIKLITYSYRFAEEIFIKKLQINNEVEDIIHSVAKDLSELTREKFLETFKEEFARRGWKDEPQILYMEYDAFSGSQFLKKRVGVEISFGSYSCIGNDLLKFQIASNLDLIDLGIYITTTYAFQKFLTKKHDLKWEGILSFEKTVNSLKYLRSVINIPVFIIGIDI